MEHLYYIPGTCVLVHVHGVGRISLTTVWGNRLPEFSQELTIAHRETDWSPEGARHIAAWIQERHLQCEYCEPTVDNYGSDGSGGW